MSSEIDGLASLEEQAFWALENGLWDGRPMSWKEFQKLSTKSSLRSMKFISHFLILSFLLFSCASKESSTDEFAHMKPWYRVIKTFSRKIEPETGLSLSCYGINHGLPKDYEYINGVGNFTSSYVLRKSQKDEVTLDSARNLIVSLAENFTEEINHDSDLKPYLDVYPFPSDLLDITIYFADENRIHLGQGIAAIYLRNGKLEYEGYEICEHTNRYPAKGKHFTVYKETYSEALDIVERAKESPVPWREISAQERKRIRSSYHSAESRLNL